MQEFRTHPPAGPPTSKRHEGVVRNQRRPSGPGSGVSRDTSNGREAEISDAGSPVRVDQDVRLRRCSGCEYGGISFEK